MGNISSSSINLPPPGQQMPNSGGTSPKNISADDLSKGAADHQSNDIADGSRVKEVQEDVESGQIERPDLDGQKATEVKSNAQEAKSNASGTIKKSGTMRESGTVKESSSEIRSDVESVDDGSLGSNKGDILSSVSLDVETDISTQLSALSTQLSKLSANAGTVRSFVGEDLSPSLEPPPPNVYAETEEIGVLTQETQLTTLQSMIDANEGLSNIEQSDYTNEMSQEIQAAQEAQQSHGKQHGLKIAGIVTGSLEMVAAVVIVAATDGAGAPIAAALFMAGMSSVVMAEEGPQIISGVSQGMLDMIGAGAKLGLWKYPANAQEIAEIMAIVIVTIAIIAATVASGGAAGAAMGTAVGEGVGDGALDAGDVGMDAVSNTSDASNTAQTSTQAAQASETFVSQVMDVMSRTISDLMAYVSQNLDIVDTAVEGVESTSDGASGGTSAANAGTTADATEGATDATTTEEATANMSKSMTNAIKALVAAQLAAGGIEAKVGYDAGKDAAEAEISQGNALLAGAAAQNIQGMINMNFGFIKQMQQSLQETFSGTAQTLMEDKSPLEDLGTQGGAA